MLPNHSKSYRAKTRRGITAMGVIFGSVALFCLLALAVDVALILNGHQQMLGGCELAARAGTPYLIDTELEGSNLDTPQFPLSGPAIVGHPSNQINAARLVAQAFAYENSVAGDLIELDLNDEHNDADGDIVLGRIESPELSSSEFDLSGVEAANSLQVNLFRTHQDGNPIQLSIASWVGVPTSDLVATATATVDQRVKGFRPVGHSLVPIIPVVIRLRGDEYSWLAQATAPADSTRNDKFIVNPHSGVDPDTGEYEHFVHGDTNWIGDGIPEIEVQLSVGLNPALNAHLLPLDASRFNHEIVAMQVRNGLTLNDINGPDGALVLADGKIFFPAIPTTSELITATRDALLEVVAKGRPRLFPLGQLTNEGGQTALKVVNFGAGRVVDVRESSPNALTVVIQPCTLITPTALTGPEVLRNPWVGKVVLSR